MLVDFARPDVSELMLRAYDRALHPELFEFHGGAVFCHGPARIELRLCTAGHVLCVRAGDQFLTEAITERQQPLPQFRRLWEIKPRSGRTQTVALPGLEYSVSCQLEQLAGEVFQQMHEELVADSVHATLAQSYPSPSRFAPAPLSLISVDTVDDSVVIHTFHTFPETCAIVKTQSLFEPR